MKNRIFRVLTLSAVLLQTYCANLTFAEENKNLYLSNVKSIREKQLDAIDFILLNEIRDIANDTYKIHFSVLVNDLEGNNFVVAKFKPAGYGIYNIMNGDIMELSTNAEFNYTKNDLRNSYYVPTYGFIRKEKGKILNLRNKQFLTNAEFDYLSKHTNKLSKNYKHYMNIKNCETVRNYYDDSYFSLPKKQNTDSYLEIYDVTDAPEAEYEVPYSDYFRNANSEIEVPINVNNICVYVATMMIILYNDILTPGFLSDAEFNKYVILANEENNDVPGLSNEIIFDNWPDAGTTWAVPMGDKVDEFLNGKNISYNCKTSVSKFWGVENMLKAFLPKPVVLCGWYPSLDSVENTNEDQYISHGIIAYGMYENGKLLVHYGYPGSSQIIISQASFDHDGSKLWIDSYTNHDIHRIYYKEFYINHYRYRCSCGKLMTC